MKAVALSMEFDMTKFQDEIKDTDSKELNDSISQMINS